MEDLDLGATIRGFLPGQRVFNRYTLIKLLGRGGMGVVWRARDESLEQDVAIKMLPEIVAHDPGSVRELKRETSRNQQLSHPHILRVFDFVEAGPLCGITMEIAEGGTLTQRRLDQLGEHFEVADIRDWTRQLCEALDHAHRRAKVVHRDLKPANLMLTADGELKVTDFGIAASLSESVTRVSRQAGSSGTPLYMSPQQMMGEKPAVTDDIYALGATVYELLAGKPPFYAGNVLLQLQHKVAPSMADRRRDLGTVGQAIPAAWEETIAACLAKEPGDRPQTAREVAERLGLVEGAARRPEGPVTRRAEATPTAATAKTVAAPRGRRLVAAIAVVSVIAAGAAWWFGLRAPELARTRELAVQLRNAEAQAAPQAEEENPRARTEVARATPGLSADEVDALSGGDPPQPQQGTKSPGVRSDAPQESVRAEESDRALASADAPLLKGDEHLESVPTLQSALPRFPMSDFIPPATEVDPPRAAPADLAGDLVPGVQATPLTDALRAEHGFAAEVTGLFVTAITDPQAAGGLPAGAVIEAINRQRALSLAEARALFTPGRNLLNLLYQGRRSYFVLALGSPSVAPSELRVQVTGAVNRPGTFTLPPGANLARALADAGGVSRVGNAASVRITRKGPQGPLTFIVKMDSGTAGPELEAGDVVYVPERML